ncbi:MAG: DegT/DnrJ/EryC1/StrS family aminotransferase [Magnetococcales bacterium]|nr:DegT/DnrJ/EryC1/StrS family aminotransferase [Magnetococcales bacterium]NGZ25661.1 DegT/DnrJ/EryC1/StrS family aminotransferase [Magnetococcales bacterium]
MIPLVDLKVQTAALRPQLNELFLQILAEGVFVKGPRLRQFEEDFAHYCGVTYGVGCSSGTTAIHLALTALGVGPGDEVIVPSHTFTGSAEPIVTCGAIPVFADILPDTLLLDPQSVASLITPATKAVIAVHLYGQMVDMDGLLAVVAAADHPIHVLEDAAQAHGADWRGKRTGQWGDVACFSFFPAKNLGAIGDGGICVCRDQALANTMTKLADHGREDKYRHDRIGFNYRLDPLQAGVLSIKLPLLDQWNRNRRALADLYRHHLADIPEITLPQCHEHAYHVYHLFVIRCPDRLGLQNHLREAGIDSGIHYPVPLHLQPAYARWHSPLPVTEGVVDKILSLPIYPEMSQQDLMQIVTAIRSYYGKGSSHP